MNDSTITLPWLVIREDDNGNRYRVGRYATRAEAQQIADSLDGRGHKQLYWVERLGQNGSGLRTTDPGPVVRIGSQP
ncbi:hypothetical protein STAFG_8709 [Streptomyces afghaniensis 772]|uniref:SPOR domain-containing protein n=1 Tax=Streptomyces afghaniensis 772 TaxID=1283301 RepID=S4N9B6_9ACTN|nr:SPOR domain-containing protein [Streptomyces afghaniensis]EPJ34249.1 hypothetical protein STAFG_8709 [Streptomyces afghaniensis 772]